MSDVIETQAEETRHEEVPEYMSYMYRQFAKEMQRRIRTYLYNTTVYVKPVVEEDRLYIDISHKKYEMEGNYVIDDVLEKIKADADGGSIVRDSSKKVVDNYRDKVWHEFFVEFKSRKKKQTEEEEFAEKQINTDGAQ